MSIEHVKLFDFFLGLFFQQVELAEKINITLGQGRRSGCIFLQCKLLLPKSRSWNILKNLFKPDFQNEIELYGKARWRKDAALRRLRL